MSRAIAIVGMACRYPDADSPGRLWENVLAGRRAFRLIPEERLSLADYWSADPAAPDKFYARQAAVLEGYEFDRLRYKIAGSTYRSTDLTHWLALDTAARALADAGFSDGAGLPRATTAAIVGNSLGGEFARANLMRLRWPYVGRTLRTALSARGWDADALDDLLTDVEARYKSAFPAADEDTLAGSLSNTIAGRICNYFDFKGGGFTVDGACSSSLLSVAVACEALSEGRLDAAIVGGVDLSIDPFELVGFAKTGALTATEMRVYDRNSSGFLPGEGCGMLVLLRQQDAEAGGLRSYATIPGWGYSSDGKGGITRPEAAGHALAIERAYELTGFDIASVSYLEGHGTGTAVGDETELRVLSQQRRAARADVPRAAVGTIKGNIGHTKAAAGVAGLIKASLAVFHGVIPPVTGNAEPHPVLVSTESALRLPQTAEPWPEGQPLRAGVSAMGFGGINVHVVVTGNGDARGATLDPRTEQLSSSWQDCELLLLDATTMTELRNRVAHLARMTPRLSCAELADLAATLEHGLGGGPVRAAVVARSPGQAARRLGELLTVIDAGAETSMTGGVFLGSAGGAPRIGYLFPGQGSGGRADGGALSRRFQQVRALYREVDEPGGADRTATAVAQPHIVRSSLAGLRVLAGLGLRAELAVGHSLGELTAVHWAGAIDEAELLAAVGARGRAMGELGDEDGAMAGISASADDVAAMVAHEDVVIAGYNGPRQTVVSGPRAAVDRVCRLAATAGVPTSRIAVSHAFHSPGMAKAADRFGEYLADVEFRPLARTVCSTVTGEILEPGQDLRELLVRQILDPVRFAQALSLLADRAELLIEVGPGRVLSALASTVSPRTPAIALETDGNSVRGVLTAVAAAYVLGAPVGHAELFRLRLARPLPLDKEFRFLANPCEPPAGTRDSEPRPTAAPAAERPANQAPDQQLRLPAEDSGIPRSGLEILRAMVAERAELPPEAVLADTRPLDELHLSSITVGEIIGRAARELGVAAPVVTSGYATSTIAQLAEALDELAQTQLPGDELAAAEREPAGIAPWVRAFAVELTEEPAPPPAAQDRTATDGTWQVFSAPGHPLATALPTALRARGLTGGVLLCLPQDCGADQVGLMLSAAQAALAAGSGCRFVVAQGRPGAAGLAKTLHLEAPATVTTVVTLPALATASPARAARAAAAIAADAAATSGFSEVWYDQAGRRLVPVLRPFTATGDGPLPLGAGDVLLATGGGKGITAECALALAKECGTAIALVGRADPAADSELAANLARMDAAGVTYRYVRADVTSADEMRAAVKDIRGVLGPVTALLHGAGRNRPSTLRDLSEADFLRTLAPKVTGLEVTLSALDRSSLRLIVTFGSIIGRAGLRGQADYATANDWLTARTSELQASYPDCRCLSLEWSVWAGTGMGERLGVLESLLREGVTPISIDDGIAILRAMLAARTPPALVVTSRTARLPTLTFASRELPLARFTDRLLVDYPGIELVAEADLSAGSDPYLPDHVLDGDMLFPAVLGLEAMAQAAAAFLPPGCVPALENVEFTRPIPVPADGAQTIRIAALNQDGQVDVVIRSGGTGFHVDHFRATLRAATAAPPQAADRAFAGQAPPRVPLDPATGLYGSTLFQGKRFQRLLGYRRLGTRSCTAEISAAPDVGWFGLYLPQRLTLGDPGSRDAFMHAIQCCVPDATLLPVAVRRIDPVWSGCGSREVRLHAVERHTDGDTFTYDVEIRALDGTLLERWDGLQLRAVRRSDGAGPWEPALLGPYLERHLAQFTSTAPRCAVEPDTVASPGDRGSRRRSTSRAVSRLLDRPTVVLYRADGSPEVAGQEIKVSAAHGAGVTLAIAGETPLACDVETASERSADSWRTLLGPDLISLADAIGRTANEEAAVAATRVWSAVECVRKAGRALAAPLTLAGTGPGGWVALRSGRARIATFATRVRDEPRPVVFTILTEGDSNGPVLRIPSRCWFRGNQPRRKRLLRQLPELAGQVSRAVLVRARPGGARGPAGRPEALHDQGRVRVLRRDHRLRRAVDQDAAARTDPDPACLHVRLPTRYRRPANAHREGRPAGRLHAGAEWADSADARARTPSGRAPGLRRREPARAAHDRGVAVTARRPHSGAPTGAITFAHRGAFWCGVICCTIGVCLHIPMYWSARPMGFRMAGMTPDPAMLIGMALILVGLAAAVYGLVPGPRQIGLRTGARVRVNALDDAPLNARHVAVLLVMAVAVTIDVMKPTTLAFVEPGMAKEYGLKSALSPHANGLPVALLPLFGIGGTVIGSLIWGWLGDRIGRRASILLAAVLFTTTAICGAMPGLSWNLLMCFLMGLGVGGLLPLTFTLLAEIIPARHRGWAMVLVGADAAAAYILTSWLAGWLTPHYSWRILWLVGLPTGVLLIVLNRWIPESPRFLLWCGRGDEARMIMQRFGARVVADEEAGPPPQGARRGGYLDLLRPPCTGVATAIAAAAIGVGLVTYGFQLWLPTNLQEIGFTGVTAANVLRNSAILGFPLTFVAAWLYGFWSSRKTIAALSAVTAAALVAVAFATRAMAADHTLLWILLAVPIATTGSLAAVLAAYGAEAYPTRIRSRATGLAAGLSKFGGVLIIALVVASVAVPSLKVTALAGAIPLAAAIAVIAVSGVETRGVALDTGTLVPAAEAGRG